MKEKLFLKCGISFLLGSIVTYALLEANAPAVIIIAVAVLIGIILGLL